MRSVSDTSSRAHARPALDKAYADAMRVVWRQYPNDPDAGVLFAEALMDLRPWDLWTADGRPQPGTQEIVSALESILARFPDHPGACHYYIHSGRSLSEPGASRRLCGAIARADAGCRSRGPHAGPHLHATRSISRGG